MASLRTIQLEARAWRAMNFPPEKRDPVRQALGVCEEAGELAHAVLKMDQGIRTAQVEGVEDAIGDIVIYAMGLCDHYELDFETTVRRAWDEVKQRDWVKNPETGQA